VRLITSGILFAVTSVLPQTPLRANEQSPPATAFARLFALLAANFQSKNLEHGLCSFARTNRSGPKPDFARLLARAGGEVASACSSRV
jgi:hypothetical protein